ncbi:hypothetical protein PVAP13_2KG094216 [Panicum virgatum]|uniref:Secreted protein n=1 Tax=Panicum virgatum TaxID=38727 RepID=A0A8T0WAZ0_PANVG|nr:hypothetical protein PVAP13_2KG094216 [Panicum virgatum]
MCMFCFNFFFLWMCAFTSRNSIIVIGIRKCRISLNVHVKCFTSNVATTVLWISRSLYYLYISWYCKQYCVPVRSRQQLMEMLAEHAVGVGPSPFAFCHPRVNKTCRRARVDLLHSSLPDFITKAVE